MNRTILSLIVAGMFAGHAAAQNVTAGDKPATTPPAVAADPATKSPKAAVDSKQMGAEPGAAAPSPATDGKPRRAKGMEPAANAAGKADYTAAKDKARTEYNDARAKCDSLEGQAMRACKTDAVAARTRALAEARTQWKSRKGDPDAPVDGRKMPAGEMKSDMRSNLDIAPVAPRSTDRLRVVRADDMSIGGAAGRAGRTAIVQARFDVAMARCAMPDAADRHTCMMRADDACKDALAVPEQRDDEGGRFERIIDDTIVPDGGPYRNVSTARNTPAAADATIPMVN
jgi:hypothetical protein